MESMQKCQKLLFIKNLLQAGSTKPEYNGSEMLISLFTHTVGGMGEVFSNWSLSKQQQEKTEVLNMCQEK